MLEKATCEGHFSHHRHYFSNSKGWDVQKCVMSQLFKLYDDPTVQDRSFTDGFECMQEKERVWGEEERKMKLRERDSIETYRKCKTDLICFCL